eukprot:scaffold549_cov174-Ochromonas_danica.AAC.24
MDHDLPSSAVPASPLSSPADDLPKVVSAKGQKSDQPIRKIICRYGPGCTHLLDPSHREKFWHPRVPKLNEEKIKSHYICNECGYATSSLPDLVVSYLRQLCGVSHSNGVGAVGCRINCLVDLKEWHEGYVVQFHKSGKHLVEFRAANEKRWLMMKKIAFYIIERPAVPVGDASEYKDSGNEHDNLAPVEETGHLTRGHVCITETDKAVAQQMKISLLYGELLPRGANKAFGFKRLDVHRASILYDLGMGTGKIVIQAFLQFKNLVHVVGVELSQGRYKLAEEAALRMIQLLGSESYNVQVNPGRSITITEAVQDPNRSEEYIERMMHLQCGNMFDIPTLDHVDVVMMETDIPADLTPSLQCLLATMKEGSRVLTYLDLRKIWDHGSPPFKQVEANRNVSDRYPTSWSVQRGHHFYLWAKMGNNHESSWGNLGLSSLAGSDLSTHSSPTPGTNPVGHILPSTRPTSYNGKSTELGDLEGGRCFLFSFRFNWSDKRKRGSRKTVGEGASCGVTSPGDRAVIPISNNLPPPIQTGIEEGGNVNVGGSAMSTPLSSPHKRALPGGDASPANPNSTLISQQPFVSSPSVNPVESSLKPSEQPVIADREFPSDIRSRIRSAVENTGSGNVDTTTKRTGRKKDRSRGSRSNSGSPRASRKDSVGKMGPLLTSDSLSISDNSGSRGGAICEALMAAAQIESSNSGLPSSVGEHGTPKGDQMGVAQVVPADSLRKPCEAAKLAPNIAQTDLATRASPSNTTEALKQLESIEVAHLREISEAQSRSAGISSFPAPVPPTVSPPSESACLIC